MVFVVASHYQSLQIMVLLLQTCLLGSEALSRTLLLQQLHRLWDVNREDIDRFIEQSNTFHPTIKFTAEISEKEITFLDTVVYKRKQKSYLKDTTDFINFMEKTEASQNAILVSMDVTSLYKNIPQDEGITIVSRIAYEKYHNNSPPIPSHYLKHILGLILKENSFVLQIHRTAMGTKMAVAFANLFMAEIETKLLNESRIKTKVWKRYIDDVFSLWDVNREYIHRFIEQTNTFHPTIKITAEI